MKWAGAANKRIPRAVLMKLRSEVTAQDESTEETASRVGDFIRSINDDSRKCRGSAFQENYERLATAADWELSRSNLVQSPSSGSGGNLAASDAGLLSSRMHLPPGAPKVSIEDRAKLAQAVEVIDAPKVQRIAASQSSSSAGPIWVAVHSTSLTQLARN